MTFGEHASPVDTIRAILDEYPFSIGLLREILQNSDDAGASKQIFLLDKRNHAEELVCDPSLRGTQGPALLACNDGVFTKGDWSAIQSLHRSSKRADTSKIGKFGIGFRSCYHITDNPQILSGDKLAILDPHHHFDDNEEVQPGGTRLSLKVVVEKYKDHLAAFSGLVSAEDIKLGNFPGTVFRMPLRLSGNVSEISSRVVNSADIQEIFRVFLEEEFGDSMLFLENIRTIEVIEIDENGCRRAHSVAHRSDAAPVRLDAETSLRRCTISVKSGQKQDQNEWNIINSKFNAQDALQRLSRLSDTDVSEVIKHDKLRPEASLAHPISPFSIQGNGKLFTYLPLPIRTGFPCHFHSLFALTPSRQNLRNSGEAGLVHGSRDNILIHWNALLFTVYLPRVWYRMLSAIQNPSESPYNAWPPHQAAATCGESTYWSALTNALLDLIVQQSLSLWPVQGSRLQTYQSTCFAPTRISTELLSILTDAEVDVSQPPEHIYYLISQRSDSRIMTPRLVHGILMHEPSRLSKLTTIQRSHLAGYLFSTGDLRYIADLPLFELDDSTYASIQSKSTALQTYILVSASEAEMARGFDLRLLPMESIPMSIREHLLSSKAFNVSRLTPSIVHDYLAPRYSTQRVHTADDLRFLSRFWTWSAQYTLNDLARIARFYVVPSSEMLHSCGSVVFIQHGLDDLDLQAFEKLRVPFIHPDLSDEAIASLSRIGSLKPSSDIPALSQVIDPNRSCSFSEAEADAVLRYIVRHAPGVRLSVTQRQALQSLSIYKSFSPGTQPDVQSHYVNLLGTTTIYLINPSHLDELFGLPSVASVLFLDNTVLSARTLASICPAMDIKIVNNAGDVQLLSLAIRNLDIQSGAYKRALLQYIIDTRQNLPPSVINDLSHKCFVLSASDTICCPRDLVDPDSPIAKLYTTNPHKLCHPLGYDGIVPLVQSLGLFASTLTVTLVQEKISTIANACEESESLAEAKLLLELIETSNFDCALLRIPVDVPWIPTQNGLRSPSQCRSPTYHHPDLFNLVLDVVSDDVPISASLKSSIGWEDQLPNEVVISQFRALMKATPLPPTSAFIAIISELASRRIPDQALSSLRSAASNQPWVPTVDGVTRTPAYATISEPPKMLGNYCQISYHLLAKSCTIDFLRCMGCTDQPNISSLITELGKLNTPSDLPKGISILQLVSQMEISQNERASLVIPDVDSVFRPIHEIRFNDVTHPNFFLKAEPGIYLAHPRIDTGLAADLHLRRLVLDSSVSDWDSMTLKEDLVHRIQGILQQYTDQQAIGEFLANAYDAKATKFSICIDEHQGAGEYLMQASLKVFQSPSLLIYNDACFSEADFKGLHNIAKGSKQDQEHSDTIGQFGLGALAMYHFSEVVMIVSGGFVLFMDPSCQHLPMKRSSIRVPLEKALHAWPDHLRVLDGLFEFDSTKSYYNGTLFRLPLRSPLHINPESILSTPLSIGYVMKDIVQSFAVKAIDSLLFTQLQEISACHRGSDMAISSLWSFNTSLRQRSLERENTTSVLRIQGRHPNKEFLCENWLVVSMATYPPDAVARPLIQNSCRLRLPTRVALAANLDPRDAQPKRPKRLFATLPLPILIPLSVNISAPFILSPDRRNIRLDEYDNNESQYNRWLFREVVPKLYLYLLDTPLIKAEADPYRWWPRDNRNTEDIDPLSRLCIEAFYADALGHSERRILRSAVDPDVFVSPQDAVVLAHPRLALLKLTRNTSLVRMPPAIERLATTLKQVDPSFVKEQVAQLSVSWFSEQLEKGILTMENINFLIGFISSGDMSRLHGLPLLPLSDGSFRTFEKVHSDRQVYYVATNPDLQEIFSEVCLIHPSLEHIKPICENGLNLAYLDSKSIGSLISNILPQTDDAALGAREMKWIKQFWKRYPRLKIHPPDISSYPLIFTSQGYISIRHLTDVKTPSFLLPSESPSWLQQVLIALSETVRVVVPGTLPSPIRQMLGDLKLPHFDCKAFIQFLESLNLPAAKLCILFGKQVENHPQLSAWVREGLLLYSKASSPVRTLPLWPTLDGSGEKAATEVEMLPSGIHSDAAQFINIPRLVHYQNQLERIGVSPLSFARLASVLESRWNQVRILESSKLSSYKRLLRALLGGVENYYQTLLAPDRNARLIPLNTLYTQEALFEDAFNNDPAYFLHSSFNDLEPALRSRMKRVQDLDVTMFRNCAQALCNSPDSPSKVARAQTVVDAYCNILPLHIHSPRGIAQQQWLQCSRLKFIPRPPRFLRTLTQAQAAHAPQLPEFLCPDNIVREDYASVAWSQRAVFDSQLGDLILSRNPDFGVPTVDEVLKHLRVLASMARDCPVFLRSPYPSFLKDLKATYAWLDGRISSLDSTFRTEPLFLNVDNPLKDDWVWRSSSDLFFNIVDSDTVYAVRDFLRPFRNLLICAGVDDIVNPSCPTIPLTPAESELQSLRSTFRKFRSRCLLTDVTFVMDEPGGGELHAHRVLLASCSPYFESLFNSGFREASDPTQAINLEYHHTTVAFVLDYIYDSKLPDSSGLDYEEMLDILHLTHYWELHDMNLLLQREMIKQQKIQPYTYMEIREEAEKYDAQLLIKACEEYSAANASKKGFKQLRSSVADY